MPGKGSRGAIDKDTARNNDLIREIGKRSGGSNYRGEEIRTEDGGRNCWSKLFKRLPKCYRQLLLPKVTTQ